MKVATASAPDFARYADTFTALGSEARLRIVRLLLQAHPKGLVVGEIQSELGVAASTLSHHLDRLKHEGLVTVERQSTFLRYRTNAETLQSLLTFLFAECCSHSKAVRAEDVVAACHC